MLEILAQAFRIATFTDTRWTDETAPEWGGRPTVRGDADRWFWRGRRWHANLRD